MKLLNNFVISIFIFSIFVLSIPPIAVKHYQLRNSIARSNGRYANPTLGAERKTELTEKIKMSELPQSTSNLDNNLSKMTQSIEKISMQAHKIQGLLKPSPPLAKTADVQSDVPSSRFGTNQMQEIKFANEGWKKITPKKKHHKAEFHQVDFE